MWILSLETRPTLSALESRQLFTLYSMRDEISRLDQKVTD
jgi:hypothetical protein